MPSKLLDAALAARAEIDALITGLNDSPSTPPPYNPKLISSLEALSRLSVPPREYLMSLTWSVQDSAAITTLTEFRVFHAIVASKSSDGKGVSITDLSAKVGIDANTLSRLLRLVATHGVVQEVGEGVWGCTEMTEEMVLPGGAGEFIMTNGGDFGDAFMRQWEWLKKKKEKNVFEFVRGCSMYEWLAMNPERGEAFGRVMEAMSESAPVVPFLKEWIESTGRSSGVFVDVGGGSGHIPLKLSKILPKSITYEVQDLYTDRFPRNNLLSNVTFVIHDFFEPQRPQPNVICYYMRWCLHNWEEPKAQEIIRAIVPALESDPETALLIDEIVLPEWGSGELDMVQERKARRMDSAMLNSLGGRERTRKEWEAFFKSVDERLTVVEMHRVEGKMVGGLAIMVVKLIVQ